MTTDQPSLVSKPSAPPEILDKAFYFIIVLWGARFRDYFLEYCVPSLLAPGNIPALKTARRNKFLIATVPADWEAMRSTAIFRELERYVEPVFIEIPPCPPGRSGCEHMNVGHKIACDMAYRDKALALVLTPDCMVSEGTMARLQELAHEGVELVLTAALRFGEEPFFENLRALGVLPDERRQDSAKPLVISGRQMAHAAVNGFHSETLSYEWDAPYLLPIAPAAWWRVPGEDGIVLHSLSWAPMLLDYGAVPEHDTSTLDSWTIDGDYLFKNLKDSRRLHVVQDSDEIFLASWGPMAERPCPFRPLDWLNRPYFSNLKWLLKGAQFRQSFFSPVFDPLKREIYFLTVRWHGRPLNESWSVVESQARQLNEIWLTDSPLPKSNILAEAAMHSRHALRGRDSEFPAGMQLRGWRLSLLNMAIGVVRWTYVLYTYRLAILRRAGQLLRGDTAAARRIWWHLQREAYFIAGWDFKKPAPPPPLSASEKLG